MLILLESLSLAGPIVAGWLLVRRIWPDVPVSLGAGLGAALGTGFAGTVYFLALLLLDSSRFALATSESVLGIAIIILLLTRNEILTKPRKHRSPNRIFAGAYIVIAALAGAAFLFALDSLEQGGWDAFVMWNLRARLIATSKTMPLSAVFDRQFLGLNPDYPLLLPSLVSRGWQYAGTVAAGVPVALAALFTIATFVIVISGLRLIGTKHQSWVAGGILLGTPFLLGLGASQYADIVICCFMTASIVLYTIYDFDSSQTRLPLLAGFAAAAAACTKNEGILFVVILLVSRVVAVLVRKSLAGGCRELLTFAGGASLGLLTIALFRLAYAPPNETVPVLTANALLSGVTNGKRNLAILNGIRESLNFGQWSFNPIPLMALHAALVWRPNSRPKTVAPWFTAAFVLAGMSCGYYAAYLLSLYDVESHVQSSLDRVLVQLWPAAVVLYSVITSSQELEQKYSMSLRTVTLRIAAVLALILVIMFWPFSGTQRRETAESRPHIEVNRREVTSGESYILRITGVPGPQVYVSYSLDGKPMGQFGAYLGADGSVDFQVSPSTPKGIYRFLAVQTANSPVWLNFENAAAITVK